MRKQRKSRLIGCPAGGTFGKDIDKFPQCEELCPRWEWCRDEEARLEEERLEKEEPEEDEEEEEMLPKKKLKRTKKATKETAHYETQRRKYKKLRRKKLKRTGCRDPLIEDCARCAKVRDCLELKYHTEIPQYVYDKYVPKFDSLAPLKLFLHLCRIVNFNWEDRMYGRVWRKKETIAEDAGVSENHLWQYMNVLKAMGLAQRKKIYDSKTNSSSVIYEVIPLRRQKTINIATGKWVPKKERKEMQ